MRHDEKIREWGQWQGLVVRPALEDDFAPIRRIAESSFPIPPGWISHPERDYRYRPDFCRPNDYGVMKAAVAVRPGGSQVAGYCYFQMRFNNDVYIYEMASNPPAEVGKVRHAGVLLLAHVLREAIASPGYSKVTANVCKLYRKRLDPPFVRTNDLKGPLLFYRKFGFAVYERFDGGYTYDSEPRAVDDTWLEAPPERAWGIVSAYLASWPPGAPPPAEAACAGRASEQCVVPSASGRSS